MWIELLRSDGPMLDYPYTSQIEGKLRETRLRVGKTRYRILYFFDEERTAVLLHGFTKATAAVEEADKKIGRTNGPPRGPVRSQDPFQTTIQFAGQGEKRR